jgi:hypothetical protein
MLQLRDHGDAPIARFAQRSLSFRSTLGAAYRIQLSATVQSISAKSGRLLGMLRYFGGFSID